MFQNVVTENSDAEESPKMNEYNKIYSFYHILLFTDMFRSLLWPSSGCRTRI